MGPGPVTYIASVSMDAPGAFHNKNAFTKTVND